MEKIEIYEWIIKIIETCSNDFHFTAVDRLIELFHYKFQDDSLTTNLKNIRQEQWCDIHIIL